MTTTPHPLFNHKSGLTLTLGAALILGLPTSAIQAQEAFPSDSEPEAPEATPAPIEPEASEAQEVAPAPTPTPARTPAEAPAPAKAPAPAPAPAPAKAPAKASPGAYSTFVPQVLGVPATSAQPTNATFGSGILGLPGKSKETAPAVTAPTHAAPDPSSEAPLKDDGPVFESTPQPPGLDQSGVPLLMIAVGGWSGYTLGTIGALGRNSEVGVPMGIATGALVGAGSTYLLTRGREVSTARATAIINAEAWGTTIGWLGTAGQFESLENPGRTGAVYGALGMGTGLLYGALNKETDFRGINLGGLSGSMGALGLNLMVEADTAREALMITSGSVALGLGEMGLGILMDRDEIMTQADGILAAHLTLHSTWMGIWAPGLFSYAPESKQRVGGALLAGSGALMVSQLVAPRLEPSTNAVSSMSLAGVYGYLAGGGVPLLLELSSGSSGSYWSSLGVIGGGVTGLGIGAIRGKVRDDDRPGRMHLAGAGVGLAHGLIIGNAFEQAGGFEGEQYAGVILASTGAGGMLGLMSKPMSEKTDSGIKPWAAATGFGWGAWYGGWGAAAAGLDRPWVWTAGLLGADVGAGVGLLGTRSGLELSARNMGYVSLCGVGGAAIANVGTLVATDDPQAIALANLAGGTLGLATGVATRGVLDKLMAKAPSLPDINLPNPLAEVGREASKWNPRFDIAPLPVLNPSPGEEMPMGAMISLTQPVR